MPSRTIRRMQAKKGETVSDAIEKRKTLHPFLYIFSIVVLVVIVVTFIGSPVAGRISGGGNLVFGSYEGKDIAYYQGSYFAQERDRIAAQLRNSNTQDTAATVQAVWYQAFINTAEHIAILAQTEKAGVNVSEEALDRSLATYAGYLDENGNPSEEKYNKTPPADRVNTRRNTREGMLANIFVSDIMYGVKSGTKESEFVKNMARAERSFSFVSFPYSAFPQDEVRKYGEANASRFVKIKASRILVKSSASQAAEIRKKIQEKSGTFEELAKAYSKDGYAEKGGDMGWRYAYDLEADFDAKEAAQKVLGLKAGELSDVLSGSFGWMIYRCDAEAVSADFTSASVLEDVKSYLTKYEKGKIEDYYSGRAGQLTRRSTEIGFDAAVREAGLKAIPTEFFPVNLGSVFSFAPVQAKPDTATPSSAVYSEDFFFRGFSLGKDQVSPPIVLDDQLLVLKLIGEQQLPDTTVSLLDSWISYIASQSVQTDLGAVLMTPGKLKDNFMETFTKYVQPAQ
jgi:peptidyl-prolyl cis-trans isomerase D